MNTKFAELKEEQKELAKRIRQQKIITKDAQRNCKAPWMQQPLLHKLQGEYRHKHIAYSLLRGRTMEQIEAKVKEGNEPNMTSIKRIMEKYAALEAQKVQEAEKIKEVA